MKNLIILMSLFVLSGKISGQQTEIVIKVNDTVTVGTPFTLEIELKNISGNFRTPEFQGLRLVGGPNTSSSFSMINGETTSKNTYKYFLLAEAEGDYFIILHDLNGGEDNYVFDEIQVHAVNGKTKDSTLIKYYDSADPDGKKKTTSKRKIRKI